MEQPGQQEGQVTSAAQPQVGPEVSATPEGSKPDPGNSGELTLTAVVGSSAKENDDREAEEQDSAELDSALSESREKGEPGTDPQSQTDGNTSCDSGTSSMDDARTPTGPPDASPECSPTVVNEAAKTSPVCLIQESSPAVLDGVEELSPVALDEIVECSPAVLDGALEPSPAVLDGTNTPTPTGLDGAAELSPAKQDGLIEPTPPTHEAAVPVTQMANGPSSSSSTTTTPTTTPGSPYSLGDQSPSTPPDSASTSGTSSPQTPTPTPKTSAPNANSNSSSPYDTDCSRRLMSEIQRTLSQESLLDELESELLSCQLPGEEGGGKGGAPTNGIPKDPSSMMVFEKCVQYKYSQQEKAIKK